MEFSAAEEAIRADMVSRLHKGWPGCRVVHELNVSGGSRRLDLAAVTADRIVGVEIKSEKDTLKRLADQVRTFRRYVDLVLVVVHPTHWDATPHDNGTPRLRLALPEDQEDTLSRAQVQTICWAPDGDPFPFPDAGYHVAWKAWDTARFWRFMHHPEPGRLLNLLWRDELVQLAGGLRVSHAARANTSTLIAEIRWHASLKEIKHGVCSALRRRRFARADDPISADGPRTEREE